MTSNAPAKATTFCNILKNMLAYNKIFSKMLFNAHNKCGWMWCFDTNKYINNGTNDII